MRDDLVELKMLSNGFVKIVIDNGLGINFSTATGHCHH